MFYRNKTRSKKMNANKEILSILKEKLTQDIENIEISDSDYVQCMIDEERLNTLYEVLNFINKLERGEK